MKLSRFALGFAVPALVLACSASPSRDETLSAEMTEAIDTYVRLQADPVVPPRDGGARPGNETPSPGGAKSTGVGGIDPVALGGALRSGATNIPSGGPATGPAGAGNGGPGSPVISGGSGSVTGSGNGGAAAGSGAGGGSAAFAEAACYMIGGLCQYIARCTSSSKISEVCSIPSSCPAAVSAALSKTNASIPPQASALIRCFGDGLASAPCVRDGDFVEGFKSSFQRCGISIPSSTTKPRGD